jgi:hypothetical protein
MNSPQTVNDASAWKGCDLAQEHAWRFTLTAQHVDEIEAAARHCSARGLAWSDIQRADFPLPTLGPAIHAWEQEINHGRGFLLVNGLRVENHDNEQIRMMFWGIGTHLGVPLSQNSYGEMLGDVYDEGVKMGTGRVRGYRTNQQLLFHTDRCDIVGLLCMQEALHGGMSSIVSSTAIYNDIARNHPEYLEPLYNGFLHANMEEGGAFTTYRVPVYDVVDGVVSCRILRNTVENARKMGYAKYSQLETDALAYMDSLANRADMRLDMMLKRGDMQFINNYTTLHARTAFEDFPDPAKRRHMARLWLKTFDTPRRVSPEKFTDYHGVEKTLARQAGVPAQREIHG